MNKLLRTATLTLSLLLIFAVLTPPRAEALLSNYTDIDGHWAEDVIDKWTGYGVLKGDDDLYRPNEYITRADLAIIISRLMRYTAEADASQFNDLGNCTAEQRSSVLKLNAAGVMLGSFGNMRPLEYISREEACCMIGRAMRVKPVPNSTTAYSDLAQISDWANSLVMGMTERGYLSGKGDGYFYPKDFITRSEVMKAIDNIIITGYFYKSGVYTVSYLGNAIINVTGVELQKVTITGDLIIAEGVAEGGVTLTDVTVQGTTYIMGGGTAGLTLKGTTKLHEVRNVKRTDKPVGYKGEHSTIIENLYIEPGSAPLNFEGSARNLYLNAPNHTVKLINAMVVNVTANNYETAIVMDKNSSISTCMVNEVFRTTGSGIMGNVTIMPGGDGSSFEMHPKSVTVPSNITVFLAGNSYYNNGSSSATYLIPTDSTPPTINDRQLHQTKVEADTITFSWKAGADGVTDQNKLRYLLFYSTERNMNTVADIERNGYPTMPYTVNKLTSSVSRLKSSTRYYFNVIVMDEAGNKSCYEQFATEIITDEIIPATPDRQINVSNLKHNELTLNWRKATDNVTPQENLTYAVYQSDSANLNTALGCEQYGKQVVKPTKDITSARITGLKENEIYYFNIVVQDEAGNKNCYYTVIVMPIKDLLSPVIGTGIIHISNKTDVSAVLTWDKATDLASPETALKYTLYSSQSDNINSLEDLKRNGKSVASAQANKLSHTLSNQKSGVYYFNVLVSDEAGNEACYSSIRIVFGVDTTPPAVVANSLREKERHPTSVLLTWDLANDTAGGIVGTPQNNLTYTVYQGRTPVNTANGSNFRTPANVAANGNAVSPNLRNVSEYEVTGLVDSEVYYFNVIVTDEMGLVSCFTPLRVVVDVVPPTINQSINLLTITADDWSKTASISWRLSNDNRTAQANLQYSLYVTDRNIINYPTMKDQIDSIENSATRLYSGTARTDPYIYTHRNLEFDEPYFFYLICMDEAGNKLLYDAEGNASALPFVMQDGSPPRTSVINARVTATTSGIAGNFDVQITIPPMIDNRVTPQQLKYYVFYSGSDLYPSNPSELMTLYQNNQVTDVLNVNGNGIVGLMSVPVHSITENRYYYVMVSDGHNVVLLPTLSVNMPTTMP